MSATVSSTFSRRFRRIAAGLAVSLALGALSAHAAPTPFPADFRSSQVVNADATINVRVGGHGTAVVLIHGFGNTGDMWSPMAAELAKDHTVVVPDLRGMGLSSHPAGGYDKWTQAGDIRAVLDKLGTERADIVGHAIGQKDEADNLKAMETKLAMPVLAIGAAKAFGANVAVVMRNAATNVQELVVPNAGHWLMEEAPAATIAAVQDFLAAH